MLRFTRTAVAAVAAVAASTAVLVPPALGAHGGSYTIRAGTGTFLVSGPANLWPNGVNDGVRRVNLPFAVQIYGHNRTTVNVSSNGNVQFGPTPSAEWRNSCLTDPNLSGPAVAVYYDDLLIRSNATTGDGVFTKVIGTSPNRRFVISWRGVERTPARPAVRAEIVFYEGRSFFDTIYAAGAGRSATVGIQNFELTSANQRTCNSGTVALRPNDKLRFTYVAP
jgi:hypothetical protein